MERHLFLCFAYAIEFLLWRVATNDMDCCDIVAQSCPFTIAIPQIADAPMPGLNSCMLTCNGAVQCSHWPILYR